jgi:hypothetical protein
VRCASNCLRALANSGPCIPPAGVLLLSAVGVESLHDGGLPPG